VSECKTTFWPRRIFYVFDNQKGKREKCKAIKCKNIQSTRHLAFEMFVTSTSLLADLLYSEKEQLKLENY